jgi:ribosomal protein S7
LGFVAKDVIDKPKDKLVELADMNEYTLKIYTLLALTMMRQSKFDNAMKIFNKAIDSINIFDDKEQYQKHVVKGNEDMAAF